MNVADAFVERARQRRKDLKLSQTELARRMTERLPETWYQVTVARTEAGQRPVRLDEAAVMADVLGLAAPFDEGTLTAEQAAAVAVESRIAEIAKHSADTIAAMTARRDEAEARAERLATILRRIHSLAEEPR